MKMKRLLLYVAMASGLIKADITLELSDGVIKITDNQYALLKKVSLFIQGLPEDDNNVIYFPLEAPVTRKAVAQIINMLTAKDIQGHMWELSDYDLAQVLKTAHFLELRQVYKNALNMMANRLVDNKHLNAFVVSRDYIALFDFNRDIKSHLVDFIRSTRVFGEISIQSKVLSNVKSGLDLIVWSPDGKSLAGADYDGNIRIWDVNTGKELKEMTCDIKDRFPISIAWSPDGKLLASGGRFGAIVIWNVNTGTICKRLPSHAGDKPSHVGDKINYVWAVAWSSDSKSLVGAVNDDKKRIRIWDVNTGTVRNDLEDLTGRRVRPRSAAWSPDGKWLASEKNDGTIIIWDVNAGIEFKQLTGHTELVTSVAWHPDSKLLASTSYDGNIRIWDVNTGKELKNTTGPRNRMVSLVWSPDGKSLMAGDTEEIIRIWDVNTDRVLKARVGHTGLVTSVAWSPDGKSLASATNDGGIRIWDIASLFHASGLNQLLAAIALAKAPELQLNSQQIKRLKKIIEE